MTTNRKLLAGMISAGLIWNTSALALDIPPDILNEVQQQGFARVIVELDVPWQPEGLLRGADAVVAQRQQLTDTQQQFVTTLSQDLVNSGLFDAPNSADGTSIVKPEASYETIPYLVLEVSDATLPLVQQQTLTKGLTLDQADEPSLTQSLPLIGADKAWSSGYTGQGQKIAVLDTGVEKTHPFFATNRVVQEACFSATLCPDGQKQQVSAGAAVPCNYDAPNCLHGTHVAGIAASVAKDAQLIAVQVFSKQLGMAKSLQSDQLLALDWLHKTYGNPDSKLAAVNLSLGGGKFASACDDDPRKKAIDNLRSVGIATIVSSGNQGYSDGINAPACVSSAISVGATDKADSLWTSSNSSPLLQLLAPGVDIVSSVTGGGTLAKSGTSMAAPHVAGAWAVLKAVKPTATVDEVLTTLQSTGKAVSGKGVTKARIQLDAAVPVSAWAAAPIFVNSGQSLQVNNMGSIGSALGDLDSDGDLDAFVATYYGNPDKVYLNDGKGGFVDSGQNLDANNQYSNTVLLADFDGDGDLDAFVLHNGGSPSKVFWNDGKGKFTDSGQQLHSPDGWGAELGDLDGDGDLDIFVVSPFGYPAQVWLNQGKGIFQDSGQKLVGNPHGHDIVLGDVDKDGDLDALVGNDINQTNKLWLNNGKGYFNLSQQAIGTTGGVVALADVDKDSDLDAIVGSSVGKPSEVWLNDGKGYFSNSQQKLGNGGAVDVTVADMDKDGDLDIFVSTGYLNNQPEEIWLNDGKGNFTNSGQQLGNWNNAHVELGDLDGDSDLDAFISGNAISGQGDEVWLNQLTQSSSACTGVTNGLVACYPFDGNANDASGNGNNGIPQSDISFVDGKFGKAAKFNHNINSNIRVPNPAQKFNDQFSVAGWVLTNDHGGILFQKYTWAAAGGGGKGFAVTASDDLEYASAGSAIAASARFNTSYGGETQNWPVTPIPTGQFQYFTVTYNQGKTRIYINTQLKAEKDIPYASSLDNSYDMLIGAFFTNDGKTIYPAGFFDGLLDDLRIYNRAISEAEVKQLYGLGTQPAKVTLTVAKTGNGQVTGNGITCGTDCTEANLAANTQVTLTATPDAGSQFAGWAGACTGTEATTTVTMTADQTCEAKFMPAGIPLTVNKADADRGRVSGRLRGETATSLTCDIACQTASYNYPKDGVVILIATADKGFEFKTWTCTGSSYAQDPATPNILKVTMTTATTCTANFDAIPGQLATLTVNLIGTGNGTVISNKAGLTCSGQSCTGTYLLGQRLTLTATPSVFATFLNWGSDCTGNNAKVSLTLTKDLTCTAQFQSILETVATELVKVLYTDGFLENKADVASQFSQATNQDRLKEAFWLAATAILQADSNLVATQQWPTQLNGIQWYSKNPIGQYTESVQLQAGDSVNIQLKLLDNAGVEQAVVIVIYYGDTPPTPVGDSGSGRYSIPIYIPKSFASQWGW